MSGNLKIGPDLDPTGINFGSKWQPRIDKRGARNRLEKRQQTRIEKSEPPGGEMSADAGLAGG